MTIKNGQKPLSAKVLAKPAGLNAEDLFGNPLGLDPELTGELEKKGLAWRFISAKRFQDMGGTHPKGWRPYKCDKMLSSSPDFVFGSSGDGYVRRGDLILATRPNELHEKHKTYLNQEALRGRQIQQSQAQHLREMVRGANIKVHEGYDDEEQN